MVSDLFSIGSWENVMKKEKNCERKTKKIEVQGKWCENFDCSMSKVCSAHSDTHYPMDRNDVLSELE